MTIQFCNLPVGAQFEFRGRRYRKLALSMACDEERLGNVFHDQTEVLPEGEPALGAAPSLTSPAGLKALPAPVRR